MSTKVTRFTQVITNPLNVHNFEVKIPGFDYEIVVQSTRFPSEKLRTVVLYTYGEEVRYPTLPQNSGEWPIAVPDNDDGLIRESLDSFKADMYDQKSGTLSPQEWIDITVRARDLENNEVFKTTLKGAWLIGREDVQLSNNDPSKAWNWDYLFKYQWIDDGQ